MKKFLLPVVGCLALFTACKEDHSLVPLTNINFTDSAYTANTVPAAQPHAVLIEEATGASCPNCPAGHLVIDNIVSGSPGLVNVIGMHIFNFPQSDPESNAAYDFRTQDGTGIIANIYGGINAMPSAGIDRKSYNNSLLMDRSIWSSAVNSEFSVASPANLTVTSSFNAGTSVATIQVNLVYTSTDNNKENLNVAIVEDSLIDKQEDAGAPTGIDDNYVFNDVLRDYVSSLYTGDAVLSTVATKQPGTGNIRTYTYKVPTVAGAKGNQVWVPANCRVIAFLTHASDNTVIQSASCKLTQ